MNFLRRIEEKIPLKQGLKQENCRWLSRTGQIEEKIPLKQGLKRVVGDSTNTFNTIEEKIPLKQGLKLETVVSRILSKEN